MVYGGSGITITSVFSPTSYTKEQCLKAKDAGAPIPECGSDNDYWAMAVDKCYNDGHRLPSRKQLKDIAVEMYGGTNVNLEGVTDNLPPASGEYWEKLGAGKYWSSDIYTSYPATYSYYRSFSSTSTDGTTGSPAWYNAARNNNSIKAFCVK